MLPLARLALDPEAASHQRHQPRRDGQSQARAAVPARGRAVGLGEGLEDHGLLLGRNADARVLDAEVQADLVADPFLLHDANDDLAVLGELDGVADQVDEDLGQPAGIADQRLGHVRGHLAGQFQALLLGRARPGCA